MTWVCEGWQNTLQVHLLQVWCKNFTNIDLQHQKHKNIKIRQYNKQNVVYFLYYIDHFLFLKVNNTPSATDDTPQDTSASLLKIDQQLATKRSVPPSTAPSSTLKDLVAAASSRSNTPNSLSVSVRKDEDRYDVILMHYYRFPFTVMLYAYMHKVFSLISTVETYYKHKSPFTNMYTEP